MDTVVGAPSETVREGFQRYTELEDNVKTLKRKLEELISRKKENETRLQTECRPGKLRKAEVNTWLQNAASDIKRQVEEVKLLCADLGKRVDKNIQEVDEHIKKGIFDSVVLDAPSSSGVILPAPTFDGECTTKEIEDEIWKYLTGNDVMKIGVCGMGGTGKTTIMKSINNRLVNGRSGFTNVIWVTVSQSLDLMKLQDRIATALNETLPTIEDMTIRAGKVLEMLGRKRFVLILDDMWESFRLEEVGILNPTEDNGCKLVITTRSERVCQSMECKVVKVKPLPENEALKLFVDQVGDVISRNPHLKKFAKSMVDQCAGLPLAIVTVAGCMKGEKDIGEWEVAQEELSRSIKKVRGEDTNILRQLQFSYDRLKDEKVQHCFLYCALYPEGFKISKDGLISYWIGEELVDTYEKGHSVFKKLVSNCLLESVDDGRSVKMHKLIRDMALEITNQSPLFMIKADERLREFPREEEWKKNLEKVSLMRNEISEIPLNLSPNCQTLSTLLLQKNHFENIPESFFVHMPNLRILDLSDTKIKDLPNSISELRYLTALILHGCWCLQHVPESFFVHMRDLRILDLSCAKIKDLPNSISGLRCLTILLLTGCGDLQHVPSLAGLSSLWKLELRGTRITEVPVGIEFLENLRYLDLYSKGLWEIPTGTFNKLFRLKELRIFFGSGTSQATVEEVSKLRELQIFEGHFCNMEDFNLYVKYLDSQSPATQNYKLLLGPSDCYWHDEEYFDVEKHVMLEDCNIRGREGSVCVLEEVQRLEIYKCEDIISLSDVVLFNRLDKEGRLSGKCSHLKVVNLFRCESLKNLLSPELLQALQSLEEIYVFDCYEMEEIITSDADEEGTRGTMEFTFPKLRRLSLLDLPKLKGICGSNRVIGCDSLQEILVYDCPELKRLPLSPPLTAIKEIKVEIDWWDSLEWDDPKAKNDLQPYCRWRDWW